MRWQHERRTVEGLNESETEQGPADVESKGRWAVGRWVCLLRPSSSLRVSCPLSELKTHGGDAAFCLSTVNINNHTGHDWRRNWGGRSGCSLWVWNLHFSPFCPCCEKEVYRWVRAVDIKLVQNEQKCLFKRRLTVKCCNKKQNKTTSTVKFMREKKHTVSMKSWMTSQLGWDVDRFVFQQHICSIWQVDRLLISIYFDCIVEYCLDSGIRTGALARPTTSFTDSHWLSLVNCQQSYLGFGGVSFPFIELFCYSMSNIFPMSSFTVLC